MKKQRHLKIPGYALDARHLPPQRWQRPYLLLSPFPPLASATSCPLSPACEAAGGRWRRWLWPDWIDVNGLSNHGLLETKKLAQR
eukprot:scaffold104802_cov31-Tisochrysis_lutea.AAC.3